MRNFSNPRQTAFLNSLPTASLESESNDLSSRSKFNFSYFVRQDAGQGFEQWSSDQQTKLFQKLVSFSQFPLTHWRRERVGGSGRSVLEIYGKFPNNSDFHPPKAIPHEVEWGRFRLGGSERLIGFVLPHVFSDREHPRTKVRFDCNTFYVVFLDENHCFYKTGG